MSSKTKHSATHLPKTVDFSNTAITGGFWKQKQDLVRNVTANAVYDRFSDTGRVAAFDFSWKPGQPLQPHYFWDSDIAKWIEGAAYIIRLKKDRSLEKKADAIIDKIALHQEPSGYFNIYFTVVDPANRLKNRDCHELYCAGHLIEAAVAYYEATGKRKFLDCMCRYADYIEKRFKIDCDTPFTTPGHEEIELALVKLYRCTGEARYLELAKFFIDQRGLKNEGCADWYIASYNQSHLPVRKQTTAEGHSVRACYLYSGMADVAYETGDKELKQACETIFDDIISHKMYITGGIGSSSGGEAFTVPYDLPNLLAYTESCAAIALAFFANRMLQFGADSKYSDIVERIIYNGFMSSLSLNGREFFYENPLEVIPYLSKRDTSITFQSIHWPQMQRSEVFDCSCCPPNIVRFIPSIANMLYTDDGETLYVHQFMQSHTSIMRGENKLVVKQKTAFPDNGRIHISVTGGSTKIAIRIPWWSDCKKYKTEKGYAYFELHDGETLNIDFGMKVKFITSRPESLFTDGKYAVMRGPVVYCMESVDNGAYLRNICISAKTKFTVGTHPTLGVPTLTAKAFRRSESQDMPLYSEKSDDYVPVTATFIPYYAFANRGNSEMLVWTFVK